MATITTQVPTPTHHVRTALLALAAAAVVTLAALSIWAVVDSDDGKSAASSSEGASISTPAFSPVEEVQMIRDASQGSPVQLTLAEEVQMMRDASQGSPVQLTAADEVQIMKDASARTASELSVWDEVALIRGNR